MMQKRTILLLLALATVGGCVTETTYVGQHSPERQAVGPDMKGAAKTRLDLGIEYLRKGNPELAKFNLDKAVQYDPQNPEIYIGYAWFYQTVRDYAAAEQSYKKVLTMSPHDADAMNNYGAFLCARGRYAEADKFFNQAVSEPEYTRIADTYENAALCALESGNQKKANDYYQLALGYSPNKPVLLLAVAEMKFSERAYAETTLYLTRYHEVAQETPESLWLRIQLAQAEDKPAQLHQYGAELVQQFPDSSQAKRYLANDY